MTGGVGRVSGLNICVSAWLSEDLGGQGRKACVGGSAVITHEVCYRGVLGCLNERRAIPHIPGTLEGAEPSLSP